MQSLPDLGESEVLQILYSAVGQLDDLAAQRCHTDRVAALGSTATARASRPQLIVESEAEDSQEETEQEDASSESLRGERSPLPRRCVERKSKDTGERHEDPSAPDKESFSVKKKQKTNKGRKKRERQAKYQRGKGKGKESIKARTGR